MIRVRRLPLSAAQSAGLKSWQASLKGVAAGAQAISHRWSQFSQDPIHKLIKDSLNAQTHGKCVYCERNCPSKIDHFYPKLKYPKTTFAWKNFNWSCSDCNFFKGPHLELVGTQPRLLNPMNEDTTDLIHIDRETGFMTAAHGLDSAIADRVTYTIAKLKLNEQNLQPARQATATFLKLAMEIYVDTGDHKAEDAVFHVIRESGPLLAVLRQMIRNPDHALRTTVDTCLKQSTRISHYARRRKWIK